MNMMHCYTEQTAQFPIILLSQQKLSIWLSKQPKYLTTWLEQNSFSAKTGEVCLVPSSSGELQCVLLGVNHSQDCWQVGRLVKQLHAASYQLEDPFQLLNKNEHWFNAHLAWGLASYQFARYNDKKPYGTYLSLSSMDPRVAEAVKNWTDAIYLGRDLINTPANDLHPPALVKVVQQIAKRFSAKVTVYSAEQLLRKNFPAIHAVGRAGQHPPQFIELNWGNKQAPLITLIGKGVCFDSGGLNIKPARGMRFMKKDMGGAAIALSLAQMLMVEKLPIRLRVLLGAVENAVDATSYRPGDVIDTRAGLTVEITNTDAEGRLVLGDLLSAAGDVPSEYLIDFSTLTGAARVALGTDLSALFCNHDGFADGLLKAGEKVQDPIWRMPLYPAYQKQLKSEVADMANACLSGYGGAITAALYLQRFVPEATRWAHFDVMAWNMNDHCAARPVGGEVSALRAVFEFLQTKYGDV